MKNFTRVIAALKKLKLDAVLDGEVIVVERRRPVQFR